MKFNKGEGEEYKQEMILKINKWMEGNKFEYLIKSGGVFIQTQE